MLSFLSIHKEETVLLELKCFKLLYLSVCFSALSFKLRGVKFFLEIFNVKGTNLSLSLALSLSHDLFPLLV